MTQLPASPTPEDHSTDARIPDAVAPGSWWGVALVLIALVGFSGALIYLWRMSLPPAPAALEQLYPLQNGVTLRYRVARPDGTLAYRSRNVERLQGAADLSNLHVEMFAQVISALGLDIGDTQQTLAALGSVTLAHITDDDRMRDGSGGMNPSYLLLAPQGLVALQDAGGLYDPPLLVLDARPTLGSTRVITGQVFTSPYTETLTFEGVEAVQTPLASFSDCSRVSRVVLASDRATVNRTWYCPGVGPVRIEEGTSGWENVTRYELIGASTPALTNAPFAPDLAFALPQPPTLPMRGAGFTPVLPGPLGDLKVVSTQEELGAGNAVTAPPQPIDQNLLYATANGQVIISSPTKGPLWSFRAGGGIYGAPVVAGGLIYVGSADRKLYALEYPGLAFQWLFQARDAISGSPAVADGLVVFGSEDRNVYALDARTGAVRWTFTTGDAVAATPVIVDGTVYIGSDDGALYALDAATGAVRWAYPTDDAITSAPVVADGVVYLGSQDKYLYALKAQTDKPEGELLWRANAGESVGSDVRVADRRVYLNAENNTLAFDAATGAQLWHYASSQTVYGSPLLVGDRVLIARANDLLALDAGTGQVRATTPTGDTAGYTGPSGDGKRILIGRFNGAIQVLGEGAQ